MDGASWLPGIPPSHPREAALNSDTPESVLHQVNDHLLLRFCLCALCHHVHAQIIKGMD